MKFNHTRFQARKFREDAGEEGGENGGGSGGEGGEGGEENAITPEQFAELQAENARLAAKINEANKHKKEAERSAREEARKKAEAEGNYQELFESSEKSRSEWEEKYNGLKSTVENKEVNSAAMKIAVAMNPLNEQAAEDLASHIAKRLKYTDEGIKVTDENGHLTVSTFDNLKDEFAGSSRYSFYIKGNQSSGGGAGGGSNGGGAAKEISRAEFDKLDPVAKAKFTKDGGSIIDA